MTELLYGRNAVRESLRAKRRRFHQLLIAHGTKPSPIINEILQLAQAQKVPVQQVPKGELTQINPAHQGVALQAQPLPNTDLRDMLAHAETLGEAPFLLALDHLADPHNLGALLRTANAVGVHGVILPQRRAATVTPTAVNVSAGAAEHLRIATVSNLVQSLRQLKKDNLWVIGVEKHTQASPYHQFDLHRPIVLVLGNEGSGLTRLVSETCDALVSLPMRGQIESLNVSVAGALLLYEVWRARDFVQTD